MDQTETKSGLKNRPEDWFLLVFFLAVILCFSAVNLWEMVRSLEPDGRRKGLEKLELVQDHAINAWGALQKAMGKRLAFGSTVYEDVTLLDNGVATMADQYGDISVGIRGAEDAYAFAREIGTEFLFVAVPGKEYSEEDLPAGVVSYANAKYYGMVDALKEREIPYIAMRDVLEADGADWYSYYYRSDHHWKNRAAFLAYRQVADHLFSMGLDSGRNDAALEESGYTRRLYPQVFLGTHGRMAGRYYTGLDDYELWLPVYETDYTLDVPSEGIHKEGDFEACFVNYQNVAHYSFDYYAYYTYLDRDYDHIRMVNRRNPEGPKLVIVRDSVAVPVSVFLISQCSSIDLVDLRYLSAEDSAKEWIREAEPDMLIYMFGPGYLSVENALQLR
ncbi:MAG: hypothetical protein IJ600_10200 [Lachnospiraceae bacterium]|nr:hypothetical protein [Lachnospiraceae bacterium]